MMNLVLLHLVTVISSSYHESSTLYFFSFNLENVILKHSLLYHVILAEIGAQFIQFILFNVLPFSVSISHSSDLKILED